MATIDPQAREMLDKPNFAHVATLRSDGSVHGVVVWVGLDGDRLEFNSAEGRTWPSLVERDPRVTVTVADGENPYNYVEIRGRVVERTTEGADAHIDALSKKYLGQDEYPFRQPGEQRVKIVVEPERVRTQIQG
jgi:PPOX class probable F420-dependent enzyme